MKKFPFVALINSEKMYSVPKLREVFTANGRSENEVLRLEPEALQI
jgi:hypothetical protein